MRYILLVALLLVAAGAMAQTTMLVFHQAEVETTWDSTSLRSVSRMPFTLVIAPLATAAETLDVAFNNDTTAAAVVRLVGNRSAFELRDVRASFVRTRSRTGAKLLRDIIAY